MPENKTRSKSDAVSAVALMRAQIKKAYAFGCDSARHNSVGEFGKSGKSQSAAMAGFFYGDTVM